MMIVKIVGEVDAAHRLSAEVPNSIRPGQVEIVVIAPQTTEDEEGAAWTQGVAREWHDELNDLREDIYTLTDGEPFDGEK